MTSPISSAAAGSRLILAASFGGPGGALALADVAVIDEISWDKKATASELATVHLADLLARNATSLDRLTHVLVNHGPGSFTGIRVALNLARTLSFALNLPIAAIDALTILAHKYVAPGERRLLALKAVRDHYYVAEYARTAAGLRTLVSPRSMSRRDPRLDETDVLIEGESVGFDPFVTAGDLVRASLDLPDLPGYSTWESVKPLYVRGSEAEEKLRK